jgi:hypothetical protein
MEEELPFLMPKAVESLLVSQHNKSVLVFVSRLRRGRSCTLEDGMVVDIFWIGLDWLVVVVVVVVVVVPVPVSCFLSRSVAVCVSVAAKCVRSKRRVVANAGRLF